LIHDGFGDALRRWARGEQDRPEGAMAAITAPRGVAHFWALERSASHEKGAPDVGGPQTVVLPNLRWRGGYVRASFANVVFANCDFRGTLFDHCRLAGATFLNCLLDGTIFSDCEIAGRFTSDTSRDWSPDAPVFAVRPSD